MLTMHVSPLIVTHAIPLPKPNGFDAVIKPQLTDLIFTWRRGAGAAVNGQATPAFRETIWLGPNYIYNLNEAS